MSKVPASLNKCSFEKIDLLNLVIVQDFTLYGRIQLKGKEGVEPGPATPLHLDLPALRKLQSQLLL
jgi:hypothetical protein